jgi:hypothetical protein
MTSALQRGFSRLSENNNQLASGKIVLAGPGDALFLK